jgi:hypothetical protein
MMTISFDTSRLRAALRTYQLATLKDTHTVVNDAARNFVKKAAAVTPPATGKLNSEAKKRGEINITGDLNHIFVGLSPGLLAQLEKQRSQGQQQLLSKGGRVIVRSTDITVPSIKGWHYANRRRNGRVRSGRRASGGIRAAVLDKQLKAYRLRVLKKVGLLMAGWNASAAKLGTKLPAWTSRHGTGGGRCAVTKTRSGIRIRMENMVGFVSKVQGLQRRIQWALNAQAGALERAAAAIIRKTARRAGFRV